MSRKLGLVALTTAVVVSWSQTVLAHPGHPGHSFSDGALHPLNGLDHLLAMVAVGLLAVRLGGRAIWALPVTFMGAMLAGGLLASVGMPLPGVEYGIGGSVLVFGLLVASRRVMPLFASCVLVGLFAMFHGHAHAAEMAAEGTFGMYAAGFLLSTATLHAAGIVGALALAKGWRSDAVRVCGAAISAASLMILLG
ncbi:MAG: HupE/UreJ family protein [Pirellulales bacterium]|jgi:urease accessory protein|nr:HupE/UreJ family protein [Pirellulales bacterium]